MSMAETSESLARVAFERWAAAQRGAPRDVSPLFDSVETSDTFVGLLHTQWHGRRVVWKTVPYAGTVRVQAAPVDAARIDPWAVPDEATLRQQSDHVTTCDACGGSGKTSCSSCDGSGKLRCPVCNGQRKMYGYAANGSRRLLNCQNCRGKGDVDCQDCRRGIAVCSLCRGDRRLQRWLELESWTRPATATHPAALARQFGWDGATPAEALAREAVIVTDVARSDALGATVAGTTAAPWLAQLAERPQPGERVTYQRLRIARIPRTTVSYHLGEEHDRVVFAGLRLQPEAGAVTPFSRRAERFDRLRLLLIAAGVMAALFSFGRGTFYWNLLSVAAVTAFAVALATLYTAIAYAVRRKPWLLAAGALAALAIVLTMAGLPRRSHALAEIASGHLDAAERELSALGGEEADAWAELRLARLAATSDVTEARALFDAIPAQLAQRERAAALLDERLLKAIEGNGDLFAARSATMLPLLSVPARRSANGARLAEEVYGSLVRSRLKERNWPEAADALLQARAFGLPEASIAPFRDTMHDAAIGATSSARAMRDTRDRLAAELEAERLWMAWENASGVWGTPPLMSLRTSMARDIAVLEARERRKRR